jgi:hypothetical protein
MGSSVFRTVGIGRVDSNKAIGSKTIDLVPIEWLTMRDGELTGNETTATYKTTDVNGNAVTGGVITSNTIAATWIPSGTNRLTAPDVRRGERVEILQTADEDKYYWKSMGMDDNLRKLETVTIGISATSDESATTLDPANMYWMELSSHTKMFSFSSANAQGEPFVYELFFDFGAGQFTLKDDVGNYIHLDSALHLIQLQNDKQGLIEINDLDINISAPRDINATAKRDVNVTATRNINMKAGTQAVVNGGGSIMTLNAASTTLKTPNFIGET